MRCSSCKPLLDRYIEATLTRRQMIDVGTHLRACAACRAVLAELRVVDGLLAAPPAVELPENFTFAVMAQARSLHAPRDRHLPFWIFLALYSCAAWVSTLAGLVLSGKSPLVLFQWIGTGLAHLGAGAESASATAARGLGHSVPPLLALGLGALVVDIALAIAAVLVFAVILPRLTRAGQEVRP